mmetsp:Transcript_14717/g.39640  ORF Transcript_14717/g.39640 Transcript_14717/m.39640 type:complete len:309 (+) Transcript_14717:113-1039(+)
MDVHAPCASSREDTEQLQLLAQAAEMLQSHSGHHVSYPAPTFSPQHTATASTAADSITPRATSPLPPPFLCAGGKREESANASTAPDIRAREASAGSTEQPGGMDRLSSLLSREELLPTTRPYCTPGRAAAATEAQAPSAARQAARAVVVGTHVHDCQSESLGSESPEEGDGLNATEDSDTRTGDEAGGNRRRRGLQRRTAPWSRTEDEVIAEAVTRFGCKWGVLAALLPGRTCASVRNRWHRLKSARKKWQAAGIGAQPNDKGTPEADAHHADVDAADAEEGDAGSGATGRRGSGVGAGGYKCSRCG